MISHVRMGLHGSYSCISLVNLENNVNIVDRGLAPMGVMGGHVHVLRRIANTYVLYIHTMYARKRICSDGECVSLTNYWLMIYIKS